MNEKYLKINTFLKKIDSDFPVPLSMKQDLDAYAQKILQYATVCSMEEDGEIRAAVIGYTENLVNQLAYIAVVGTLKEYRGQGLAKTCMENFIRLCREKHISAIHLYTTFGNTAAIGMYRSFGFQEYQIPEESRPQDAHLILKLSKHSV